MELLLSVPNCKYKLATSITIDSGRLIFKYPFSREMNAEIKSMEGCKYHGYDENGNPTANKFWSVADSPRNWFNINYMAGKNVFEPYDKPLIELVTNYEKAWDHQKEMAQHIITGHRKIFAYEMGTGKSRGAIMGMEQSGAKDWWFIGTKGSLRAMPEQFSIWKSKITPTFMTYDFLKKTVTNWPKGKKAPQGVIFDEASKIKSWTAQRTQAAYHLSCAIEKDWGENGFVILMTGSPAPKDSCDWWSLCEICKPGFLREGTVQKLKNRLSLQVKKEGQYGIYPEHVTWWDNKDKCKHCGQLKEHKNHNVQGALFEGYEAHKHEESINEIEKLYHRMKGLVVIKFKKEVLSFLPDKRYVLEQLTVDPSTLRAAKTIVKTAKNVITGLTLLRELSDGFQYVEIPDGDMDCKNCSGTGIATEYFLKSDPDSPVFDIPADKYDDYSSRKIACPVCENSGRVKKYVRTVKEVACPKDDLFIDLLDNHEDTGRFICYAGYTASIDRCVRTAHKNGWATICVDGRGWIATDYNNNPIPVNEIFDKTKGDCYLQLFQNGRQYYDRVCYTAHPGSGGLGVTLTASIGAYYYSNSFTGEDRWQSEDRGHRPGMDLNKGFTIYDGIHLPSDRLIIENLAQKKDLQALSLGVFQKSMDAYLGERPE